MNKGSIVSAKPLWEIPITVKSIEELAFRQIKARTMATIRRGII